jgi:hypothetical protein
MRFTVLLAVLIPSVALAQPGAPDPTASPPGPPPSPPGGYAPAPYAPPPPPPYQQPLAPDDGFTAHRGVTFEANLGVGYVRLSDTGNAAMNSDAALAGANLGIGGWINRQLAITFRIAGVQIKSMSFPPAGTTLVNAFFGPSLQYWLSPNVWLGGGAGFSTYRFVSGCTQTSTNPCGLNGFGLDARAGYSFGTSANTFNLSVEITPGFYSNSSASGTATGVAFLAGYQYL